MEVYTEYLRLLLMLSYIVTSESHKCYVCGEEAPLPFIEEHWNNNSTIIDKIPKSCDEFERYLESDFNIFEFQCPRGFTGCVTKITFSSVVRTCIDVSIEDCRTANNEYVCICTKSLCNKQSIPVGIIDIDDDDDNDDDETDASGDTMSIYSKTTNWPTFSTTENYTMIAPLINTSVSFNLSYMLAFIFAVQTINMIVSY